MISSDIDIPDLASYLDKKDMFATKAS